MAPNLAANAHGGSFLLELLDLAARAMRNRSDRAS